MTTISSDDAVAIIGVSFRLPQCSNWRELIDVLAEGRDCIRPIPDSRVANTKQPLTGNEKEGGWLDEITGFDHRYFGIALSEAEYIDPRQRIGLQLATEAIINAGYTPEELSNAHTAVLVAAHGGPHPDLFQSLSGQGQANPFAFIGSLHAFSAGRIAYLLDLRGPVFAIDTGCSSFLVALHEARNKILTGEADFALVGGCELVLGALPQHSETPGGLGVESTTDRCRPFDAMADGAGFGEGGGFVLLKRLSRAYQDNDVIHAVIRGSAVNHDGSRSNGITAPSSAAQTEVITAAWRQAGVTAADIGYIEAHGTGTKIGDPIEVQGLIDVFATYQARQEPCIISSVKGNFGHLSGMAGLAGLVRIMAQFKTSQIFPTVHFQQLNPLCGSTEELPIHVSSSCESWARQGQRPYCAGLSGFGLSGTNVHLVVEEAPSAVRASKGGAVDERLVLVSAQTAQDLSTYLAAIADTLSSTEASINEIADILMLGRRHLPFRWSCTALSISHLVEQLENRDSISSSLPSSSSSLSVGLIFDDYSPIDTQILVKRGEAFPAFQHTIKQAENLCSRENWTPRQRWIIWLLGNHAVLAKFGIAIDLLLAHGAGKLAAQVIDGTLELADALHLADVQITDSTFDKQRLQAVLQKQPELCLVRFNRSGELATAINALGYQSYDGESALLTLLGDWFVSGADLNWQQGFERKINRRLELPYAPFIATNCWPETIANPAMVSDAVLHVSEQNSGESVEEILLTQAKEVLKEPGLTLEDDFFAVGGNSLNGEQLIVRLNEVLGTDLKLLELLDCLDLNEFCQLAKDSISSPTVSTLTSPSVEVRDNENVLSGQQLAIWAAMEISGESGAYNVPAAVFINAEVDIIWLEDTLTELVLKQPMLRCSLKYNEGGVSPVIHPPMQIKLVHTEIDLTEYTIAAGIPALTQRLRQMVEEPLSPYDIPPTRFELIQVNFSDGGRQVLLLNFHHLFFDGWSWRLVLAALSGNKIAPPVRDYFDYVVGQYSLLESEQGRNLEVFWAEYLANMPSLLLPSDGDGGRASDLQGANLPVMISKEVTEKLKLMAMNSRVTVQMLMLTTWAALQWQISAQHDICVAMPVANRQMKDENTIGCYVNTVIVRTRIEPHQPFRAVLNTVRQASLNAISHSAFPADRIQKLMANIPYHLTMFDFQNDVDPIRGFGGNGAAVELLDVDPNGAKYPLNFTCIEYGNELQARLEYSASLFSQDTAYQWLNVYVDALTRLVTLGEDIDLFTLFDGQGDTLSDVPDFQF
ncbi:phenolpthiocerol synthesis type-I polyketide synthase PpsD [Xenorhabdus mauleonii]|uniref:HxxPF-repeated domain-containing protein n=1 Tax=Xenorhabdus mauleonii TaxID=351675 RepID=A0A1I3T0A3_9GAMM|nr:beta-ketoacyl synthase N-terminal-like domain-containing protein [Xenorhabdus mauleonii]PHM44695.1 phenolpthiocerol synthesis type-I polyketide synthase PpsD [Xenorhabdus mauleonii]SFJ64494.1 HxxPF-repeated domain-containing protein [Xenorhabdus mauleonii]